MVTTIMIKVNCVSESVDLHVFEDFIEMEVK